MSASISLIANMNVKADSVEIDACWSRIGVRGDRSCPELERHIHCRNCPKYGAAARAILDTRSPDSSNASWNEPIPDFRNLGERAHSATVFSLGAERFGLPTHRCV